MIAKPNKSYGNSTGHIVPLVKGAIEGKKSAFEELYEMISGKMYSLCLRYTGSKHGANEAFQDGLLRLYRSLAQYQASDPFESWARKIFVLACIDHVKKKEIISYPDLSWTGANYTSRANADDAIEPAVLHSIIQQLPVNYRLIANLCLVEEYEHGHSWEILGIPEATGKQLLSQVVKLLESKTMLLQNG